MSFKIDLHLHSNHSDGSKDPKAIIDEAYKKGMQVIAICDHDVFTVNKALQNYAKSKNVTLIQGIEISCMDDSTQRKVHILGYGFKHHHPHLDQLLIPFRQHVTAQRLKMLEPLQKMGFDIRKEDLNLKELLYKQDIALAMEKKGYGTFPDLFSTYFRGKGSLEKQFPVTFLDVKTVIETIHQDGGIAVLAHPRSYNTFDQIEKYIAWGLDGIEISHPSFKEGDLEKILHYPLLHFGGSDYHGSMNLSNLRQIGNYGITQDNYNKIKELIEYDVHD